MSHDDRIRLARLPDTRSVRIHFEREPGVFRDALGFWRGWKCSSVSQADALACRDGLVELGLWIGAEWSDLTCVLRAADRRLSLGLPCPPWWNCC